MPERGVTYGLKYQARSVAAVKAGDKRSRWLVGTVSLREENEVQLLQYDPDKESIELVTSFAHEHEIWQLLPHPTETSKLLTVRNKGGQYSAVIWQLPRQGGHLEQLTELQGHAGPIRKVAWCEQHPETLVSLEEGYLRTWSLQASGAKMTAESSPGDMTQLSAGCWNPFNQQSFFTADASNLQVWDLRSMKVTSEVPGAHSAPIRDVDASKQQEHLVITAGDDAKVRYWDIRQGATARPLAETSTHRHWVWQARFNPAHHQLVLSSSSDALVSLTYNPGLMASVQQKGGSAGQDAVSRSFDDHEESVYGVAWSHGDPWVFASLSYDGRFVVNKVPGQIKYKILI